jgi:hypothetical protein
MLRRKGSDLQAPVAMILGAKNREHLLFGKRLSYLAGELICQHLKRGLYFLDLLGDVAQERERPSKPQWR